MDPEEIVNIGTRLSYNLDLCTVRFVGRIPPWPVIAYGVEWDDPERGKHDGTLNGVRYFDCIVNGAGSFVKSTRKSDKTRTFDEAIQEKYLKETSESAPVIRVSASKVIETYGADKIKVRQAHLDQLETAFLIKMQIRDAVNSSLNLSSLKHLNLGYNLLTSSKSVLQICSNLPMLEILLLNGNRLTDLDCSLPPLTQVKELSLSNTLTTPSDLLKWALIIPNCQVLTLAYNNFVGGSEIPLAAFSQLKTLDLSYNRLDNISSNLPDGIKTCILSHNEISRLSPGSFESIKSVDLSYNRIESWDTVDLLHTIFPNASELRLNSNLLPVSDSGKGDQEIEQLQFIYVLARWGGPSRLSKLNGMEVSEREQLDAELYFMSKVGNSDISYNMQLPRWAKLCQLHGFTVAKPTSTKEGSIGSKILQLTASYQGQNKSIKVLKNITVQKLKALIARSLKITGVLPQRLELKYRQEDTGHEIVMDDELMAVSYYNLENGSVLFVNLP